LSHLAYVNWETKEWDIIEEATEAVVTHPELWGVAYNDWDPEQRSHICKIWWQRNVPEKNRAFAMKAESIEYDRILLCDELGDHYNEGPHLLVEYVDSRPFSRKLKWIQPEDPQSGERISWPKDEKRIAFFPNPIPDEREEYYEEVRKRREESDMGGGKPKPDRR
jgi:hypothetical protein